FRRTVRCRPRRTGRRGVRGTSDLGGRLEGAGSWAGGSAPYNLIPGGAVSSRSGPELLPEIGPGRSRGDRGRALPGRRSRGGEALGAGLQGGAGLPGRAGGARFRFAAIQEGLHPGEEDGRRDAARDSEHGEQVEEG